MIHLNASWTAGHLKRSRPGFNIQQNKNKEKEPKVPKILWNMHVVPIITETIYSLLNLKSAYTVTFSSLITSRNY